MTDQEQDTLTYQLTGTDAALFTIDNSGNIVFNSAPDFDTDAKNVYNVVVEVSDGVNTSTKNVIINVQNGNYYYVYF